MKSIKQSKTKDFTFAPRTACILGSHSGMRIDYTIRNFRNEKWIGTPLLCISMGRYWGRAGQLLANLFPCP